MLGQMRATWVDVMERRRRKKKNERVKRRGLARGEVGRVSRKGRKKGKRSAFYVPRPRGTGGRTFSNIESSTSGEGAFFEVARTIPLVAAEKGGLSVRFGWLYTRRRLSPVSPSFSLAT